MSRMPLTPANQQSAPIREFTARGGELNLFRLLANAPAVTTRAFSWSLMQPNTKALSLPIAAMTLARSNAVGT